MNKLSVQINENKLSKSEILTVLNAEKFASKAHAGQKRLSGEPYITHPVAVAQSLADWGMDSETIVAGLLHDTVEDTEATIKDINERFGPKVAELVEGVTKLGSVDYVVNPESTAERQAASAENIRKLLLAMTRDLRVIVIKLADRRHNLMTLKVMPPEKQQRIARESLEIYAPLADRLGMGQLKAEIEDLSFRYTDPESFHRVEKLMKAYLKQASRYLAKLKRFIATELKTAGLEVISIEGREKHLYSVYKKLAKAEDDFDKIYDLVAVRIIVPEIPDCYQVMGILHQHFKPLIYRIKDYIAVPKPNGYRSLHTTVFALDGRIIEIQIRTPEMHEEAEHGLAAHFFYDSQKISKDYAKGQVSKLPAKYTWVSSLTDLHAVTSSGQEFVEALKVDLFQDRIFVFTPKGDLYDLPEGSTPIDFAFSVHSDVGLRAQGAKINGRLMPLDSQLQNRDVVDILTRKQPSPNRDWLNTVRTPHARNRIRAWFRTRDRDQNIISGKQMLESELKVWHLKHLEEIAEAKRKDVWEQLGFKDQDGMLASIGEGVLSVGQVTRKLFPAEPKTTVSKKHVPTGRVVAAGAKGLPYHLSPCCQPAYPHPIVGYITRGSGVTIHLEDCPNLPAEPDRVVTARWELEGQQDRLVVPLEIVAANRVGLLRDLTGAISAQGINIGQIGSTHRKDGQETVVRLDVELADLFGLANLLKSIEHLPGVLAARLADA
ncbi:MAG TPA: bifunctional (p)ppGpp synthetase/guanosine-3',5'-bis(diphosphate) 3'-pyrophosphohydrolase [Candidatus Nanoarchaeia archaeon]|nr:bifunctional (p)ppGpp synthetase/guanosine-3',5'-bis(diphosphate) 3'-pyrophosphohydrolase [Candidatus Nanoarchaeia archaeon]